MIFMRKSNDNIIILEYILRIKLLGLFCAIFLIGFPFLGIYCLGKKALNIWPLLAIAGIMGIFMFIHTFTECVIVDKNKRTITQHKFYKNKVVPYDEMHSMKLTEDENTAYCEVFSKDNKRLLKVNMLGFTNFDAFFDVVTYDCDCHLEFKE